MSEPGATPVTPEALARERSADIPAGTPLTLEEAGSLAAGVAGEWHIDRGEIRREFTFRTFNAAFGMATRIALLAEAQGHHPELEVGWTGSSSACRPTRLAGSRATTSSWPPGSTGLRAADRSTRPWTHRSADRFPKLSSMTSFESSGINPMQLRRTR